MKYKKNKLRLNGFYFLVKFGLVFIYALKVYHKKSSSFFVFWEKICLIHYWHFSFEKHVLSQVLKDFSVENLETISSTFLSKFSCEIYLSWISNYWSSIFTLHLTGREFSLVCVLSIYFFSSFFLFLLLFSLTDTNYS